MATVTVEVSDDASWAPRQSPMESAREMRVAAAVQRYHQGLVSQGKAAEIAGLKRKVAAKGRGASGVNPFSCQVATALDLSLDEPSITAAGVANERKPHTQA